MFLAGHEPHGQEPEPQWLPGPLENRPRNHRCLALARRTVEQFALRRPRLASSTAMGTRETRRPAQVSKVTPASRLISEPRVEFLESPRIIDAADEMARRFHPLMLSLNATGVKRIPPFWENYDGEQIQISQSYWRSHVQEPKTKKSKAPVPVIAQLAERLNLHRLLSGNPVSGLMFPSLEGRPINLDALARDVIRPALESQGLRWYGWHAFRRGLATNLHRLGVQDKIIQRILRQSNVAVTQACYIKTADADVVAAMRSLENAPSMHLESTKKTQLM